MHRIKAVNGTLKSKDYNNPLQFVPYRKDYIIMKLDRNKLEQMVTLSDDELWRRVVEIGKGHGFILPEKTPPHDELEKLRELARDGMNMNVMSAIRLINKYRG